MQAIQSIVDRFDRTRNVWRHSSATIRDFCEGLGETSPDEELVISSSALRREVDSSVKELEDALSERRLIRNCRRLFPRIRKRFGAAMALSVMTLLPWCAYFLAPPGLYADVSFLIAVIVLTLFTFILAWVWLESRRYEKNMSGLEDKYE